MAVKALQNELDVIELSRGDVIIEITSGNVGVLLKKDRRIDIHEDDIYFWKIKWNNPNDIIELKEYPIYDFFEEEHLKLSIILGIMKWQSVNGGTFELRMECIQDF
tara:strand:+ start:226 stop:543 length:318 start_codon:yes stop_codon:yes gene_type:complete